MNKNVWINIFYGNEYSTEAATIALCRKKVCLQVMSKLLACIVSCSQLNALLIFYVSNFNAEGNSKMSVENSYTNGGEHSSKVTLFILVIWVPPLVLFKHFLSN